jgi:hypothetical protein
MLAHVSRQEIVGFKLGLVGARKVEERRWDGLHHRAYQHLGRCLGTRERVSGRQPSAGAARRQRRQSFWRFRQLGERR